MILAPDSSPPPLAEEPVRVPHVVELLRERLYGAISCLATLAVLTRYTDDDTAAWTRVLDVTVAAGGLWAASLLAHWVAHLAVYGRGPRGKEALTDRAVVRADPGRRGGAGPAVDGGGVRVAQCGHREVGGAVVPGRRDGPHRVSRGSASAASVVAAGYRGRLVGEPGSTVVIIKTLAH